MERAEPRTILRTTLLLAAALAVAGCSSLMPRSVEQPAADPQIPPAWGAGPASTAAPSASGMLPDYVDYRTFLRDPRLVAAVEAALTSNRDLRQAVLNVERARAAHAITAADRVPTVGASGQATRSGGDGAPPPNRFNQLGVGITAFELDLFGRVKALDDAALARYLATSEARRAAQVALVAEVANAWLNLAGQRSLRAVAADTVEINQRALDLAQSRHQAGAISGLDLAQAEAQVQTARTDLSRYDGQIAQAANLLQLLVGRPLEAGWLPDRLEDVELGVAPVPAGMSSSVLLRRPDVMAAEHMLQAAGANIAAARAAYFPRIALTGSVGVASQSLGELFDSGTGFWSFVPSISLPLFDGGRRDAALNVADVDRRIALAAYEQAIQAGFREVSDALALQSATSTQLASQEQLLAIAQRVERLSDARYRAGADSSLQLIDAQRNLYGARLGLVAARLVELLNRVASHRALGGGSLAVDPPDPAPAVRPAA